MELKLNNLFTTIYGSQLVDNLVGWLVTELVGQPLFCDIMHVI
jgi:hypothetical protein